MPRPGVARHARRGPRGRRPLVGRSLRAAGASLPSRSATASGEPAVESAVTAAAWFSTPSSRARRARTLTSSRSVSRVSWAPPLAPRARDAASSRSRTAGSSSAASSGCPVGSTRVISHPSRPRARAAARAEPRWAASRPESSDLVGDVQRELVGVGEQPLLEVGRQRGDASIQRGELGATGLVEARHRRARPRGGGARAGTRTRRRARGGRPRRPRCGRRDVGRAGSRRGGSRGEARTRSRSRRSRRRRRRSSHSRTPGAPGAAGLRIVRAPRSCSRTSRARRRSRSPRPRGAAPPCRARAPHGSARLG